MPTQKLWNGRRARVAVVGAGAFGCALARCIAVGGCRVTLFGRGADVPEALHVAEAPSPCLKDLQYMAMESAGPDVGTFDLAVLAVPCQSLRDVSPWVVEHLKGTAETTAKLPLLSAAKGIERKTLLLPHQILEETLGAHADVGTLSGPSFARELEQGLPTAVVVATRSDDLAERAQLLLHRSFFRVYRSSDLVGTETGGALKNVIAMVAGAVDGLHMGNNARAAVITRGLQEIARVGVALGAQPLTFLGLSGLGDLILTCTGDLSRNRQFGLRCARGEEPAQIIATMGQVIEGVATAESAYELSCRFGLDTPILKAAHDVIYAGLPMREAMFALVSRSHKGEFDGLTP